MKSMLISALLLLLSQGAFAAGTYTLVDVAGYNLFAPVPTSLTPGATPLGGTAVVDGAGNVSITGLQFSFASVNAGFEYTAGTWSTTVGGTSITNTGTCLNTTGTPCTDSVNGLTALGNSSFFGFGFQNDGVTPTSTCFQANLVNGFGGACDGVSIVETQGVSLVITEQSEFWAGGVFPMIGSGFVFTFIPIPAAVWLFASALGLLGFVRRRMAV